MTAARAIARVLPIVEPLVTRRRHRARMRRLPRPPALRQELVVRREQRLPRWRPFPIAGEPVRERARQATSVDRADTAPPRHANAISHLSAHPVRAAAAAAPRAS